MQEILRWPEFLEEFEAAAVKCGFISEVLLETEDGPVVAWQRAGKGERIYLSSGIHGDEPAGPLAVLEMMREGCFPENFHWMICPALNPGGLASGKRENRQGYDLNRDYLKNETRETSVHSQWLRRNPSPDLFVSMHEDWESSGFYFYEINLDEDDPGRAKELLEKIAPVLPPEPEPEIDGHEVREPGWIYHECEADISDSWPEAIFVAKNGCPLSFTFETPSEAEMGTRIKAHIAGFHSLIGRLG
ncbi:MAG: M14 family metallopeptidase [Luteolibacter sp.]